MLGNGLERSDGGKSGSSNSSESRSTSGQPVSEPPLKKKTFVSLMSGIFRGVSFCEAE